MAKIEITKTELVWPGKYNEDGTRRDVPRVNLPFQVIETINESRATREEKSPPLPGLFDVYKGSEGETFAEGWKNKLIWGDNLLVMSSLLDKFAGKIDLVYIDPPFATGTDFSFTAPIGESNEQVFKEQSIIEEKAYRDSWGRGTDSYVPMMAARLAVMRELLSDSGSLCLHCDWRVVGSLRLVLEEVFGYDRLVNELIWVHQIMGGSHGSRLPKAHETILWVSKKDSFRVRADAKEIRVPFSEYVQKTLQQDEDGKWFYTRRRMSRKASSEELANKAHTRTYVDDVSKGTLASDVWTDMPSYQPKPNVNTKYPTQKPDELLERLIAGATDRGGLVADFFCGSGTTMAVAERLGRRWIGCDLGRYAIHTARKRLLGIENCEPFEILNLGKYERQYWQGVTFAEKGKTITEKALYEYLAFVLKLYGAQPVAGLAQLHGKKGRAMVHIGAVDAPVTIDEINSAISECVQLKQVELHLLGWEWEMGVNDLMVPEAKKQGVKLLLLQIPREVMEQQAVEKGDIQFFELAYLEVEIEKPKKLTVKINLKEFIIPNTELIPEEVRSKVKRWSDYIDYWAIDWDFQNDTFMQGWVNYRTRTDRSLALVSDQHLYEKAGSYRVLVKVVDIFGNDTTQAFDVSVK